MASIIEEMYAEALGIEKLSVQGLRFAMGYLAAYSPDVFQAVMEAAIQHERNLAMAHGDEDKKQNQANKRDDRKVERKVKDVLRKADPEKPGESAGKTDGKKD